MYLLDIYMGEEASGINLAKEIRKYDDTTFDAKGLATRAQVATMIMRSIIT